MIYLIVIVFGLFITFKYNPSLEYIKESKILILHYDVLNGRDYKIIFSF